MSQEAIDLLETLKSISLFAGQCDESAVDELINLGIIERYYDGAAGFFGLAKLRIKKK